VCVAVCVLQCVFVAVRVAACSASSRISARDPGGKERREGSQLGQLVVTCGVSCMVSSPQCHYGHDQTDGTDVPAGAWHQGLHV